jgi:hypothetical protein
MKKDISNKAMLVSMKIGRVGATKVDRSQSDKLTDDHQMERGSAKVSKMLFRNADLKRINSICNEAKSLRDKYTLPWNDHGQRMLPSSVYRKFDTDMQKIKNDFDVAVRELEKEYPSIKEDAKKRLNGMFNEEDYPDDIKTKFKFDLEVVPMPKGSDLRIDVVSDEEKEKIIQDIENRTLERIRKSSEDVAHRILSSVVVLLQGTDGKSGLLNPDARFHATAVTKLQEIIDIAPQLNVLDDPNINKMVEDVRKLIKPENLNPKTIRDDENVRNQVLSDSVNAVESIKNAMSSIV